MGSLVNASAGPRIRPGGNLAGNIYWHCKRGFLNKCDGRFGWSREALMILRHVWFAAIGVTTLAWSGLVAAQQYRADELLHLDLSRAVLSPKPLGPAATFAPGPLDVTIDRRTNAVQANSESEVEPKPLSKPMPTATVHVESNATTPTALGTATSGIRAAAHARAERSVSRKPHALVALHQRNPVEAQARETKIQVWPCKSGGICGWKR
jgi:hypothetical protein